MRDFGGMVSFTVRGGEPAARRVAAATELFTLAESLGAVESLIEHPAAMTHASVGRLAARGADQPRPAVGRHRDAADLVADLEQALEQLTRTGLTTARPVVPSSTRPPNAAVPPPDRHRRQPAPGDAIDGWAPSPGGLVRALLPLLREQRRDVDRLDGRGRRPRPSRSRLDGVDLHPVLLIGRRGRGLLRGLLQRHAVAAVPRRAPRVRLPRRAVGGLRDGEPALRRHARRGRPAGRASCGSTTTTCSSCRRCCATSAPTCGSGSSSTSRSRPYELFAPLPWRDGDRRRACSAPTCVGFQRQLGAQNFIAAARRLLHAQIDGADVRCDDRVTRVGTFPISIDVEEFEALAAGRATRRRASTDPHPSRRARR